MTRRKYIRWGATAAVTVGIAVLAIRQSVPKIAGKPITTLLVEMNETEPEVAAKAQGILRTSGTKAVPALIGALDLRNSRYRNSYNLFRTKLPSFLQPFIPELEDKSAYRLYSANALATLGASAKPAIPKLKELLRDENDMVRCAGARTLGSIGRDAVCVAPELVTLLKSTNVHVRLAAALALWKIDTVTYGSAATQGFVAALQGDYAAKADAISCLGEISKMQLAVRPLMEQLNPENHYRNRIEAAIFLGRIGSDANEAVQPLTEALFDRYSGVRQSAAQALGEIGPEARSALPALYEAANQRQAAPGVFETAISRIEEPAPRSRNDE